MRNLFVCILLFVFLVCFSGCGNNQNSQNILQQSNQYSKQGDSKKALEQYLLAFAETPDDVMVCQKIIELGASNLDDTQLIAAYENLMLTDFFEPDYYVQLAMLYGRNDEGIKQRDLLEKSYRLNPNKNTATILETIVVDVATETADVRKIFEELANSTSRKDFDTAISTILQSKEYLLALKSDIEYNKRNYNYKLQNGNIIKAQTIYKNDTLYTSFWGCDTANNVWAIQIGLDNLILLQSKLVNNSFNGDFELTSCYTDGSIYIEKGTFENNICIGAIQCEGYIGLQPAALAESWQTKNINEKTVYAGVFDKNGFSTEKQLVNVTGENAVIYAYTEKGDDFLYLTLPDGQSAETQSFNCELLGVPFYPVW